MAQKAKRAENIRIEETIIEKPLEKVLPDSMMPYSEYILLDRALPRVEDGLKPVQRRILYSMLELGLKPDAAYKKSARVVGDCLGKYHPHGDQSVYLAMVRLAQDFNMRNILVDGHGNFGSIDGDPAAAQRYTEVRLAPLALELLKDLDKETVKWNKNFDDSLNEPDVLPGRFPNLLVNGATGIAIGLATNIPSHNLSEVIDGCIAMIERPNIKLDEMMGIIKGPDFPTGAFLESGESLREIYETGRGRVALRAKTDIENEGDRQNIVITEIPYGVDKSKLEKRIFDLKELKKELFANISDVADESDRNGVRIVVKLKKGEDAVKILNLLFKHTDLQTGYNANIVAIAGGKPKQMGLLEIIKYYLEHQKSVVLKRSQFEIAAAKKRAHIVEGYDKIIPAIDEVIAIIRTSPTRAVSKTRLRERFELSEAQAEAILSMQLGNINKMDVEKYRNELKELKSKIDKLASVISSSREQYAVVKRELEEIRDRYKIKRLTTIVSSFDEIEVKPFDPTKRTAKRGFLTVGADGGVKLVSGRNFLGANREIDAVGSDGLAKAVSVSDATNKVLIFSSGGYIYNGEHDGIKEARFIDKGTALSDAFPGAPEKDKAVALLSYNDDDFNKEVYIYTKFGNVKKSLISALIVNKPFYQGITLKDGDAVIGAEIVNPDSTIIFVSSDGQCVNSSTEDYPLQGRIAGGVIGINLNDGAETVYAGQTVTEPEERLDGEVYYAPLGEIIVITDKGMGKRVITGEFDVMKRNRKGVRIIDIFGTDAKVIFAEKVLEPYNIAVVGKDGEITAVESESIRLDNRNSKGRPVIRGLKIDKIIRHIEEID